MMMLKPGTYLQDRYEILSLIGTGGMAEVYQAKCHTLNRLVAIKVLKDEYSQDSNFVSKFKLEAQAAAGLSHPNIVSVYDVVDDGSLHYIVMELIEGITLKSYIRKKGHLGVKETIGIAIQVAQGIAAAHDQHIVHRDIKPQNMIISRDGKVKVADFGIARGVSSQTIGANAVGSVHYISPEQAKGGYSDARSDIYSLGITMFEMATGHLPFDGENTVSVALAHLEDPIPRPTSLNPEITPSLERIILKCTSKRPDRRYQDAYELVGDLRHALVDPEDQYLKKEMEYDDSSTTVVRGKDELNLIIDPARKGAGRADARGQNGGYGGASVGDGGYSGSAYGDSGHSGGTGEGDGYGGGTYSESSGYGGGSHGGSYGGSADRRPAKKKRRPEEDVNPQMEKLLTIIGVVAAVIVVAVVVAICARLLGVFNLGSGNSGQTAASRESVTAEASLSSTETRVPQFLGLSVEEAEAAAAEASVKLLYEYAQSEDEEEGLVIGQSTAAETVVSKQSEVTVTIGEGSGRARVELASLGLEQMDAEAAQRMLEARKLTVVPAQEHSDTIVLGTVIRCVPTEEPERDFAYEGESVTLYVSSGPDVPSVLMPKITGLSENNAKVVLEAMGLQLGERKEVKSTEVEEGLIISQDIPEKTETPEGTAVGYTVSLGKGTRYVAAVNDDFQLKDFFGPSTGDTHIQVSIVMKQVVNGEMVTKVIMQPREIGGDITLPIHYNIEGAYGVQKGELQVLDLTNDKVLKTYTLEFLEVDG